MLLMYSYAYYLSMHALYVVIYLLFIDDAWKKEETLICAKIGIVMPLLIFKIQCTNSVGVFYFSMNCQGFVSKVKSYLYYHQSQKMRRLKVHIGP
jgi:amino acid permease